VAEICTIAHYLCENIRDICLIIDMQDGESAIGDPFTNCVLMVLDVSIAFCGHVMTPLYTGVIILDQRLGPVSVAKRIAKG
jgi:hypothetical protein